MGLKEKTISGLLWSFIDNFASQGVQLIVGLILARILSPREFGLIGMLTIFIAVSQSIIDSGFSNALIRKENCTQKDYSTIFYFNVFIGVILYILLYCFSNSISIFFNEPQLKSLIQILGIGLILNSLVIIQRTILTKELNFKIQMRVSIISSLGSGIIAIVLANNGYGVWSLVALTLSRFSFSAIFLWLWSKWKPVWVFSTASLGELFSFGSKLLVSGLIETIYRNLYNMIIGRYFSATQLGYYTQADQLQSVASQNLNNIITRVSYPVLSSIQKDTQQLRIVYKKLITSTMLITFVLMIFLAAIAKSLILVLIGDKWLPSIIYVQMLCFVGMFYPLHALNLNMLQVKGRSDLFLRLEIIKKILAVPIIIIGVLLGIKAMILGMILLNIIAFYINSYWSGSLIGYSTLEQVKDIIPSFCIALFVGSFVFLIGHLIVLSNLLILLVQLSLGTFLIIVIVEIFRMESYIYMKDILLGILFIKK
jgi:O-antigen/teichoic acid export membrane protein